MAIIQNFDIIKAIFVRRVNRFVVECVIGAARTQAYLPNPGRMWELLFPGVTLFLTAAAGEKNHLPYKVVGAERDGMVVMLDTHWSNQVAEWLIANRQVPGWEEWAVARREMKYGNSRFDLLLERGAEQMVVEVKSCTLFGNQTAMFPDAITERGRRHLQELAHLTEEGICAGVLFLVQWPRAQWFLPDYHTDLAFAQTFYHLRHKLNCKAIALAWQENFSFASEIKELIIPWNLLGREIQDGGNYIVVLYMDTERTIAVGSKGDVYFPAGYYLYVGSAKHNLTKRLERHKRKRKKFHWHVDYLREAANFHAALAIRSTAALEHTIAAAIGRIADWRVDGFGASDCRCDTHLFGMANDPLHHPAFIQVLQYFRMDRLEEELAGQLE